MTKADCPRFDACSAPLCPLDAESMEHCAWFPDEEICKRIPSPAWVKRQKRVARATGKDFARGCFTVAMLAHPCKTNPGVHGLDPETEITEIRVKKWIAERGKVSKKGRATPREMPLGMRRSRATLGSAPADGKSPAGPAHGSETDASAADASTSVDTRVMAGERST
jgi:hypothetical protein